MAIDTATKLMARVKALREALNLSQEAFAERAGLSYKHYQQVESGKKLDIKLPTLEKLAKGCGLKLSELLDFETIPAALAEAKANEFTATSRKDARKTSKRAGGKGA